MRTSTIYSDPALPHVILATLALSAGFATALLGWPAIAGALVALGLGRAKWACALDLLAAAKWAYPRVRARLGRAVGAVRRWRDR